MKGHNQQCEKASYEMREIRKNHISCKGLISRKHKELLQLNGKKNKRKEK